MKLSEVLSERRIQLNPKSACKRDMIAELVEFVAAEGCLQNADEFVKKIMEREALHSTGLVEGIAIPHAQADDVRGVIACMGICRKGIEFDTFDGKPVQIVFLIAANVNRDVSYLKLLNQIVRVLGQPHVRDQILMASSASEVIRIIAEVEEELTDE